jgi:hypothetical protein
MATNNFRKRILDIENKVFVNSDMDIFSKAIARYFDKYGNAGIEKIMKLLRQDKIKEVCKILDSEFGSLEELGIYD